MTITVRTLKGDRVSYSYDPEHRESVIAFYDELIAKGEIITWWLA